MTMCKGYYERLEPIDLIECPSKWKQVTKPCSRNWQTQADLIIAQNQTLCQDEHFAKSDAQQSLHQICLPRLQTFIFSATLTLDPRAQRSHLGLSKTMNGTDQMEPVGGQLSHSAASRWRRRGQQGWMLYTCRAQVISVCRTLCFAPAC